MTASSRRGSLTANALSSQIATSHNESARPGSEIILEAETHATVKWGPNRMYTYVDPRHVKSPNPGYCFKLAGWRFVKRTADGKHLLVKEVGAAQKEIAP